MDNRDLYTIFAAILPPLLGLGLIELYLVRDVSITFIIAGVIALALLMIVVSALLDVADIGRQHAGRRRRRRSRS